MDIFHETYYSDSDFCPRTARRAITVYDMIHERFRDNFPASDTAITQKALAVRRADHVICISEHTRRDLIELLKNPPKGEEEFLADLICRRR